MVLQEHLPFAFGLAERTLPALLAKQAERFGNRRLFVCGAATWSYQEARNIAAGAAGDAASMPIGRGAERYRQGMRHRRPRRFHAVVMTIRLGYV